LRQEKNPAEVGLRDTGVPLKKAPGAPSYRGRGRRFGYPGARGCIPAGSHDGSYSRFPSVATSRRLSVRFERYRAAVAGAKG